MDAPKCKLCGKRHWTAQACGYSSVSSGDATRAAKLKRRTPTANELIIDGRSPDAMLEERISTLEALVDELLASKRKRSTYMQAYMAQRRAI